MNSTSIASTCSNCNSDFPVTESDQEFYKTMKVPAPTWCADCRYQRRLAWRNERVLYSRKCDGTGEQMLSVYSEDKPFPVYNNDYWYSDKWDALDYGRDYDFTRPFFEQFEELTNMVPQLARSVVKNDNCDYVNQCGMSKDCYLIFEADHDRNCYYSNNIFDSRDCMEILHGTNNELCYECVDCHDSYDLKCSQDSKNCSESWFLKNCIGCMNCFGSVNLRNKQYYFLNQKYSKEEYEQKVKAVNLASYAGLQNMRAQFAELANKFPQKYIHGIKNEDSTGDYISHTERCYNCFDLHNSQDCRNVNIARNMKMVHDVLAFGSKPGVEFSYEVHETGAGTRNILFSDQIWGTCHDISYSKLCVTGSKYLFGCVGLRRAEYCILNKQYSKEEYEEMLPRIIRHMESTQEWGQFFPMNIAPYGYNETMAQDYFPMSKEDVLAKGLKWKDKDQRDYQPAEMEVPDAVSDVPDTITNALLACTDCAKNYRIIGQELRFCRGRGVPLSKKCPDCRHYDRLKLRNPQHLHDRECAKCQTPLKTSYAPDRPEAIHCESCYEGMVD
jgi:hypothetical protein